MTTTVALQKAINHVKEFHPTLSIVMFDIDGRWQYMDEDFDSFVFDERIDVSILEEAGDSIETLPFIHQIGEQQPSSKTKTYFQLKDGDNEEYCILLTDASEDEIQATYNEYIGEQLDDSLESHFEEIGYPNDPTPDGLIRLLELKGCVTERVWVTEIYEGQL